MAIYLGFRTALMLYASPRCMGLAEALPLTRRDLMDAETSIPQARREATEAYCSLANIVAPPGVIDVIAPSMGRRTPTPELAPHVWSGELPPGAFIRVSRDTYLSTPEFCFLQMARTMSVPALMILGMAMCGRYWPAQVEGHMLKIPAITSTERLRVFMANVAPKTMAMEKANLALRWLSDNAWSPMESSTYLIMCLPRTLGGYGLPKPVLNKEIPLSREASRIVRQPTCYVDLCWPDSAYGLEYYGAEYHREPARDIARELALKHDGILLQPVMYRQIKHREERRELVAQAAEHTGKRLRKGSQKMLQKRIALLGEVLPNGHFVAPNVFELDLPDYALPQVLCA